jgi:type IV pilus assembly protein PilQ
MSSRKSTSANTFRGALVLLLLCSYATFARGATPTATAEAGQPVARSVRAATNGEATLITITGTAPMAYTVRRPDAHLLVVELPGVDSSKLAPSYRVSSPLVSGVTVKRDGGAVTSLQVALRAPVRERSHLAGNELVLELLPSGEKKDAAAAPAETATAKDASADRAPQNPPAGGNGAQTSQGQQYGQPGFVGEPINLNVVNADIRDILNYITEQYGVNFVVDSSVQKVPVTINVTEVPWNFALDSILKANRLGIEVNGNILRIATTAALADEARIRADEEGARKRLHDAQMDNAPLVTEFIRLNYARASGTLTGVAGSNAGFTGGSTDAGQAGGGGNALGTSGDQGILPIIARRLSRRGGIEVDGRSNTLIVTDVRENIGAILRLVQLLDQPEPQVEIETRIVIANRNFSRDLGVQLSALALSSRGGSAGFSTAPGSPPAAGQPNTIGTRPGGIPQGILNPSAGIGASDPTTVIGLTTGLIGTAQISALITAAEQKGQAKIVATPRVTALNNRTARIESGSQIPVITPQAGGAGGAAVFTTRFVSIPLTLSITPQITDAGTVILNVVMENNAINLTLTNALGTPGIDTQRMMTEVLVPDGGTTVVGGVLSDRESETQNRTPGLSGIPVLGNLFKRRAVTRNTDEILFFITPRIYRPDYNGRRVENQMSTGTRSVQIQQPVPLGNPSSNTPVPTSPAQQLQQTQPGFVQPGVVQPGIVQPLTSNPPAEVVPPAATSGARP